MSWRKDLKQKWQSFHWPVIGGLAFFALALGYIGFEKYFADVGDSRRFLDILYRTLQLLTLESGSVSGSVPWELELARLLAPAVAAYAALKALMVIFREQLQTLRVRFTRDHVVICGLGQKGMLLAQSFRKLQNRVVVIELDEGNDFIDQCRDLGAVVFVGDAADRESLRKARVHKAKHLVSVCGDDGVNAEVAVCSRELVGVLKRRVLTCVVHIVDPQLCYLLKEQEMETGRLDSFRLEFFNVYDSGARSWLEDYSPFTKADYQRSFLPHLLIVGVGKMGESLVVHAAKKWKDIRSKIGEKIRVTLIDKKAELKRMLLCSRYPQLDKICDINARQMDIESSEFQRAGFLFDSHWNHSVTSIYVCLDNDSFGLSTALSLYQHVKMDKIPLVVRMTREAGLATLLRGEEDDLNFSAIQAFGLLDRTCKPEQVLAGTNENIAQAMHKNYAHRQEMKGETTETNPSMVAWNNLPEDLMESNRQQADHIGEKLKELGCGVAPLVDWDEKLFKFTGEEIELIAKMEHKRFMSERQRRGWKKGPKDVEKKRTPYLVSWEELTPEIIEEDKEAVRNLPFHLAEVGFKIYRLQKKEGK